MNVCFPARLALPLERAMSEVDFQSETLKQRIPKRASLLALADRVSGNEPDLNARALNVCGCLAVPARYVIENSRPISVAPDKFHILALLAGHQVFSHKRRIAEDEAAFCGRKDFLPVETECVAADDSWGFLEREAREVLAEGFGEENVHLVIHEPHGDFGYARGPLADLDAIEGVDVHLGEALDVKFLLIAATDHLEDFDFQQTQFAVGNDEEIAAAAGRIEEAQAREFLVEAFQFGFAALGALEFPAQVIEEKRANDLEDVALAGVMPANLSPFLRLHDGLKERTANGGGDARPVEAGGGNESVAHVAVEVGEAEILGKEFAVDIGECGKGFVEILLAFFGRCI